MRALNTLFFLLLSMTTIIANNQNTSTEDNNEEDDMTKTLKQCEKEIEEYKNCIYGAVYFTKENIDNVCNEYHSEKCQTFIKDPMVVIPSCQSLTEELKSTYEYLFIISKPSMAFFCQKNENNELCPLVKYELSGNKDDNDLMKAVNDTCQSKNCKTVALDLYSILNDTINDEEAILNEDQEAIKNNNTIRKVYQTLKSDNCIASKDSNTKNIKEDL